MRNKKFLAAALALTPLSAAAHVTLAESSAPPGSHYLAHFRIGHGCSGSPTTQLSVALPDGVSAVEPQPAPGWTVELAHGGARVSAVIWKGGTLAADAKGEFAVAMTLPDKPGVLLFPATQTCASGAENWSDAPGGKSTHPAPALYIGIAAPKSDGMAPGMVMPPGSHM